MDSPLKFLEEYVGVLPLDRAGDGNITVLQNDHLLSESCEIRFSVKSSFKFL